MPLLCALSVMLDDDFRRAALPLLEAGEVDALEWSFDVGWSLPQLPPGLGELLDFFGERGRLLGHGVTFSPLSGAWHTRQADWLERLRGEVERRRYAHISEHFGFMTAGDFHQSAPLPVPRDPRTLEVGRDRLRRLAETARVPVGLENLAFAFGPRDVAEQGRFLDDLLQPVDGFLLLDLHNLYCQAHNFGVPGEGLMEGYPLDRVRELHVSGGSWSGSVLQPEAGRIRRDTHDDAVPEEVFRLLRHALAVCPNVQYVTLERLGGTISPDVGDEQYRDDFRRMRAMVAASPTHAARV